MNIKNLWAMLLLISVSAALSAQEAKQTNVKYVQEKAAPYEAVILQGSITTQMDWDEFIFSDESGSIKLELEGPAKYDVNPQALPGSSVRIYGVVDKDHQWDRAEVKVLKIRIIGSGSSAPAQSNTNNAPIDSVSQEELQSSSEDINMEGRDALAEAFDGAYGDGSVNNIPDNF